MKNLTITFIFSFISLTLNASHKTSGDKKFHNLSYVKAIEHYLVAYNKDEDVTVVSNLAESYVHLNNFEEAIHWYELLFSDENHLSHDEQDVFYYSESLRVTGDYDKYKEVIDKYSNLTFEELTFIHESLEELKKDVGKFKVFKTNINTPFSDCSPVFHGDKELVFMSDRKLDGIKWKRHPWSGEHFYNLIIADIADSINFLSNQHSFSKKLNTKYEEGPATFSDDVNAIIYSGTITHKMDSVSNQFKDKFVGNMELLYSEYDTTKKQWVSSSLFPLVDSTYSIEHPSLSADGNTLYFATDRPYEGHQGKFDLYFITKSKDGKWSDPQNLGDKINTSGNEGFPFHHESGKLFFSSDGHPGLGKLDVFVSEQNNFGNFSHAMNLGAPVNSYTDDFGVTFNKELTHGYFSSDRPGGEGLDDIYAVKILSDIEPSLVVTGKVFDQNTGLPLDKSTINLFDHNGEIMKTVVSDSTGLYSFSISHFEPYNIAVANGYYTPDSAHVLVNNLAVHSLEKDIPLIAPSYVEVVDTMERTVVLPIHFDFDKYDILSDENPKLVKLANILKKDTAITVDIKSHTDCRGSKKYNLKLSSKRADATKSFLLSQGVRSKQIIKVYAMGESSPVLDCQCSKSTMVGCSEIQHRKNRRSEFVLKKIRKVMESVEVVGVQ